MSKHTKTRVTRRRRRDKNFVAIPYSASLALSTLVNNSALAIALMSAVFGEDIYIVSIDWLVSIRTLTAGEGPLVFGFAHGDLSVGEITEALDAEVINPDDIIAKERARRPVRRAGIFSALSTEETLNNGNITRAKILFSVGETFNINAWVRNQSGGTLTTGAVFEIMGTLYGRWQR